MERILVISSDGHAGLPPERYRDYIGAEYHEMFDMALPIQNEMLDERNAQFLNPGFMDEWETERVRAGRVGAWDSDERNRQMDREGIAAEIIFPDAVTGKNAAPFGAVFTLPHEDVVPELQWVGARAHNRWLAEFCAQAPERRAGIAMIPLLWDVGQAVAEIEWAHAAGLKGILIPVLFGPHPPFHDPVYEPVWEACAALDMPIHTHGGACPDYGDHVGTVGILITETHWWCARPVWFLIWGGVFERHPKLKFVITELGASWVPELKALMDQRFSDTHFSKKLGDYRSHLSMKPSEYFDRNVWIGASVTARCDVEMRHEIGMKKLLWGADYPHPEGTWPKTAEFLSESFRGFPEPDVRAILGGNALDVYRFDLDALRPLVERIGPRIEDI